MPRLETLDFHVLPCHNKTEVSRFSTLFNVLKFEKSSLNPRNRYEWTDCGNSERDENASEDLTAKQSAGMESEYVRFWIYCILSVFSVIYKVVQIWPGLICV